MVNRYNQIPAQVGNSEEVMATENTKEINKEVQCCGLDTTPQARALVVSERAGAADPIPFHRHCQKTVCSAYGYNGNGATWETLSPPEAVNDLANLNLGLQTGETWISKFQLNRDNITQDLRTILELIDATAGYIAKDWNLTFKNNNNVLITSGTMSPWRDTNLNYTFSGFGRDISLSIDGQPLSFNTMKDNGHEMTEVTFTRGFLQVNFNGEEVKRVNGIVMPDNATIDIDQDFNKHPTSGYSGYLPAGGPVDGRFHVFRHSESNATDLTPTFVIDEKYATSDSHAPIVEWELHLKNIRTSGNIQVNTPSVKVGDSSTFFNRMVALTDQMYVEPGKTNVYVFRADMYSTTKVLTYSLAYVY